MKYVISLGGSIINPGKIQTKFLQDFVKLIKSRVGKGDKFYIVTGGGAPARKRIKAARRAGVKDNDKLDWIGINASWENAGVLQKLFAQLLDKSVFVSGGEKPGQSTDAVAVKLAKKNRVKIVLNLSNVDYVYTADPKKDKKAKKIEAITHKEFLKLIGKKREPGGNYPFDPVASRIARKSKIKVVVMNGKKLSNIEDFLNNKEFQGTIIE